MISNAAVFSQQAPVDEGNNVVATLNARVSLASSEHIVLPLSLYQCCRGDEARFGLLAGAPVCTSCFIGRLNVYARPSMLYASPQLSVWQVQATCAKSCAASACGEDELCTHI